MKQQIVLSRKEARDLQRYIIALEEAHGFDNPCSSLFEEIFETWEKLCEFDRVLPDE